MTTICKQRVSSPSNSWSHQALKRISILALFIISSYQHLSAQQSSLVFLEDGSLTYTPFAVQGQTNAVHVVPDFSHAGYMGGGIQIPTDVPTRITVIPEGGDDTQRIQDAIDEVAALPLDEQGFRGAVLLKKGHYTLSRSIVIGASGIVLRGEGQGKDQTVLHANLRAKHSVIEVTGASSLIVETATYQEITSPYVPIGTYSFEIADASQFSVGDKIVVTRTPNEAWINALGMDETTLCGSDTGCNGWTPGSYTIDHERVIAAIDGNEITVNIPIVDVMEAQYGGGKVAKANASGRISQSAVENLRVESFYLQNDDEDHAWTAIEISHVENCWVKQVTGQYMGYSTVAISNANFNTVEDCAYINPISQVSGGRRYSFVVNDGLGNLFQRNYSRSGRHDFVTGSRVTGPNAFIDGLAEDGNADIGPHHRWATGTLFENILASQIRVRNRGSSGTGHGWAGAQTMFWNVETYDEDIMVESPLGAINWGIGNKGPEQNGAGFWESWGQEVLPRSLYLQQLQDRLGVDALDNIASSTQKAGSILEQLTTWRGIGSIAQPGTIGEVPTVQFVDPESSIFMNTWQGMDVEVDAADVDGNITAVTLLINGEPIASDTLAPYIFENIRPVLALLSEEVHLLTALATDDDGNVQTRRLAVHGVAKEEINLEEYEAIELCEVQATTTSEDSNPANVIDGDQNPESRWSADENGSALVVESCEAGYVDVIGISWYRGDERQAIFDLEISLDSMSWRNIYSGNSSGTSLDQEVFETGGDSIKYMRYTGYGNSSSAWNSITEVDFYGEKLVVDTIDTDTTQQVLSVVENQFKDRLTIFPNPTSDRVNVSSTLSGETQLDLYDLMGRSLLKLESNTGNYDFALKRLYLNPGIYLIQVSNGKASEKSRIIIRN